MQEISKTEFKARALEVLREIEQTGVSRIITDRGRPTLEVKKLRQGPHSPLETLRGSVSHYIDPTEPVADDEWDSL